MTFSPGTDLALNLSTKSPVARRGDDFYELKEPLSVQNSLFNFFDVLLVGVLAVGALQGRKHGMSGELMGLLKWLSILFGCAVIYHPVAQVMAQAGVLRPVSCSLLVYVGVALAIFLLFSSAQRRVGEKLNNRETFGRGEFYLGMVSGTIKVCAMLLVGLALLNARSFTPAEIKAMAAFQDSAFGSQFFPTLNTVQSGVFERSLTGPWIRHELGFLLINPPEPDSSEEKTQSARPDAAAVAAFQPAAPPGH
jgi:hypothetical protein